MAQQELNSLKRLGRMRVPGRWLIDALEANLESSGPGRTDPGWFHPSNFGHECDAFLAFAFLGVPGRGHIAARNQRIFDLGSGRDHDLKKLTKKAGISLIKKEEDRKISIPSLHIRGELDEWVQNPATGRKYVIDFKTMNNDEFQSLESVKPSHHKQVHPYEFSKETYEGYVLYENKNNQEWKVMPADFSAQTWQNEIVQRIERILTGLRGGYVRRTPVANEAGCPFYYVCSSANIPRIIEESQVKF